LDPQPSVSSGYVVSYNFEFLEGGNVSLDRHNLTSINSIDSLRAQLPILSLDLEDAEYEKAVYLLDAEDG